MASRPVSAPPSAIDALASSTSGESFVADALVRDVSCLMTKALAGALYAFGADRGL
jgi:hypothetical protein